MRSDRLVIGETDRRQDAEKRNPRQAGLLGGGQCVDTGGRVAPSARFAHPIARDAIEAAIGREVLPRVVAVLELVVIVGSLVVADSRGQDAAGAVEA